MRMLLKFPCFVWAKKYGEEILAISEDSVALEDVSYRRLYSMFIVVHFGVWTI